jgi:hypothetical protein
MKPFIVIVCSLFAVSCAKMPHRLEIEDAGVIKVTPIEIPYEKEHDIGFCTPLGFTKCIYSL